MKYEHDTVHDIAKEAKEWLDSQTAFKENDKGQFIIHKTNFYLWVAKFSQHYRDAVLTELLGLAHELKKKREKPE